MVKTAKKAKKKPKTTKALKTIPKRQRIPRTLDLLLKRIMLHQSVEEWASTPNPHFKNKTPLEVWSKTPDVIKKMVNRISQY